MKSLYGCLRQKGEASNSKCVGEPDSSALEQLEGGELERVASASASLLLHQHSDKLNSRVALFALEEKSIVCRQINRVICKTAELPGELKD